MSEEIAASIGDVLAENARLKVYLAQVTERALAAEAELARERDGATMAARWNTRMAGLRAAEQLAQQALGAAIGPTQRLACCARPDYPDGAAYCISCGRRI